MIHQTSKKTGFQKAGSLINKYKLKKGKENITKEFQYFGYHLADALNDMQHLCLYMKMAKTMNRGILEKALSFVSDYGARNKAKLFMWKVKELRAGNGKRNIK